MTVCSAKGKRWVNEREENLGHYRINANFATI